MFLDILLIAVTVMHIQIVHSQNNVTLHTETATPYVCQRALQLKCTYTGTAPCCSGSRTWRVDGTIVMNTGVVNDPYKGKYREGTVSSSGKYFNLVIENLKQADLAKLYFCKYDFDDLLETVTIGKTCLFPEYLITNLGYMIAGNVPFGIITLVIIEIVIRVLKGEFWKDWIGIAVVAAFYVIVSFLLNNVIAGVVGMHALYCDPRMILAGSGTSVVGSISAFLTYKYVKCFTAPFSLARLLVLTSVEAIVIGVVDLVVIGKLFQGQCDLCGWRATGWAVLATVCTALGVVLLILKFVKKLSWKKAFVFSCLILGRTLVVDIVVAIPFGIYLCPCTGWKDPLFILLGIIYTGVVLFVFWPVLDAKEDNVVLVLMTFCGLVISVIGLIIYGIIHGNNPKAKADSNKMEKKDSKSEEEGKTMVS